MRQSGTRIELSMWNLLCTVAALSSPCDIEPPFPIAGELTGIAKAKDGDGLLFGKVEIRLQGIAAPEFRANKKEPGGEAAYDALEALVGGNSVTCYLDGTRAAQRPVAVCSLDGNDIGEWLVANGHALDCTAYSEGRYAEAQRRAKMAGKDLSLIYALPGYC
jgi:endonuclease YncB( thermonuclease family)